MWWLAAIFRGLFVLIDGIIYWAVNTVYNLFITLSETGLFTQESIREFASRIYVLLGVFMLFKVTFSLITYILNPDTMVDRSKGMGKLVTNFIVVLIGIVIVPYAFQAAYSLQSIIIRENVIGNIIMGTNAETINSENYQDEGGKLMSFTTLSAFVRLNPNVVGEECANRPVETINTANGNKRLKLNDACPAAIFSQTVGKKDLNATLLDAYENNDVGSLLSFEIINMREDNLETGEEEWLFNYNWLISSVAGGFLAWILLIFCIDIATRSVKLGFLQLIAPIPIISHIDPKGEGIFKKWLGECGKTYADLFIRLLAIYFALFVITAVVNGSIYNVRTGETLEFWSGDIFVVVLIIFGALMFAKQLPELISNITGVKLSGGFTLNPMKKLGASPYAAGLAGLAGGTLGGMAANAWALGNKIKEKGFVDAMTGGKRGLIGAKNFAGNMFSPFAGAGSAGFRGMYSGLTSGGKGSLFDGAAKGIKASSQARNLRDKGYGIDDKLRDKATDLAGVKFSTGTTSKLKNEINQLQQQLANAKMNEQNNASALQHRISEQQGHMKGLMETFNWSYERNEDGSYKKDEKGNLMFETKSWMSYGETEARKIADSYDVNWDELTDEGKKAYVKKAADNGAIVQESVFDELNGLYQNRISADIEGKKLEKQIKDLQEDMGKFKGEKK